MRKKKTSNKRGVFRAWKYQLSQNVFHFREGNSFLNPVTGCTPYIVKVFIPHGLVFRRSITDSCPEFLSKNLQKLMYGSCFLIKWFLKFLELLNAKVKKFINFSFSVLSFSIFNSIRNPRRVTEN